MYTKACNIALGGVVIGYPFKGPMSRMFFLPQPINTMSYVQYSISLFF